MYKVIVTTDGISITASQNCRTRRKAEQAKAELLKCLKTPVQIDIVNITCKRTETPRISTQGGGKED